MTSSFAAVWCDPKVQRKFAQGMKGRWDRSGAQQSRHDQSDNFDHDVYAALARHVGIEIGKDGFEHQADIGQVPARLRRSAQGLLGHCPARRGGRQACSHARGGARCPRFGVCMVICSITRSPEVPLTTQFRGNCCLFGNHCY